MSTNTRKIEHKCEYCLKVFKNKEFMKHKAQVHKDKRAIAILEELKDLE
jgi:hypothetical protein